MKRYNRSRTYRPEVLEKLHGVQLEILKDFIAVCEKNNLNYFVVYGTAIGAVRHHGFIPWDDDIDVGMLREDYERFCEIFCDEMGEKYNLLTPETDGRYACTVTHIQRKGTKFVSEASRNLKCEQCIFMDIFPFDAVAEPEIEQKRQARKANFWGKLLFLAGSGEPIIAYEGIVGELMGLCCKCIHWCLRLFHIKPLWLYRRFRKAAEQYNKSQKKSEYVTSFEYQGCLKDMIKKEELFPLRKIRFENLEVNIPNNNHEFLSKIYGDYLTLPKESDRVNHMPLIIQFEGEKEIYE